MFVYLSKRIAIPNGTVISSIAWNEDQGWLACGGANGLLKVLKLDNGTSGAKSGGLSLNQSLEGHERTVTLVTWNNQYRKLTSYDESGRIIVWTLHKGMWFEEMVNNRDKSRVVDLSWSVNGTRICIAYEDGAVIVGGVDGNRLWGREFNYVLSKVCWSQDDRYLLFGTKTGEVFVHDVTAGQLVSQINIQCEDKEGALAGLAWHPAWVDRPEPLSTLAICYASGKMQLMAGIGDEKPYLIDTGIPIQFVSWNPQGTVLAVCGTVPTNAADKFVIAAQFFSNEGIHLRTLRVTGNHCGGISWEGDGLRVGLAVDSSVYFANVRPDYKYCYFKKTLVFCFNRPDKVEDSVMFWNVKTNERSVKHVRGLLFVDACRDTCAMVSRPEESQQQCMVQLLNAIGCPIETRFVDMEPYVCATNSSHVVCCGEENIYIWQFRDPNVVVDALDPVSVQASRSESHERVIHVEDIVRPESEPSMAIRSAITNDLICAVCMSEGYLFVARESGVVHLYQLDPLRLVSRVILPARAQSMAVNCDSTRLSVIDLGGIMHIFPVEKDSFTLAPRKAEPNPEVERRDVWNVRWSVDNPNQLVVMEKTRMFIFNGNEVEDPVQTCANLCQFKSLTVRAVQFDELMRDPEHPRKEYVVDFECKALRDARDVLQSTSTKESFSYIDDHPHPKLWELLAEHALSQLDFTYAEMAFIRCKDYPAIQFVKRIRTLDDPRKQSAEVDAYYHRFDEAEKRYKEMDRKDLALELRNRLGDWFGVVRLVQEGGGDESLMLQAWENIGDHYANHQKWSKAAQYYTQCRNYRKLAHVFYIIEDFEMLSQLVVMAEHDKELLLTLGDMFLTVGLAEEAARAFVAAGEPQRAVNGCVELNFWDKAIVLAEQNRLEDVGQLLSKYSRYLIRRERLAEAIELYRKAGQHDEAAKLLAQLGQRAASTDPLKAKQFYVLSALEVEKYRKKKIALNKEGGEVVEELLQSEHTTVSERTLDAAWRGAEAYHFFLMCQRQIAERNADAALVLAMRLMFYDDLIAPVDSYSLVALTAYMAGNFGICSKAFTRLESAERNDEAAQDGSGGGGGAGGGGGGQLQLMDVTMDLDVTHRSVTSGAGAVGGAMTGGGGAVGGGTVGGGGSALAGTTTSLQLTNPSKGIANVAAFTYPTVGLADPSRRFADLAVKIFTAHPPVDTSVDSVQCPECGAFNKEWATGCVKCHRPFAVCIITGRSIVVDDEAWQCPVCHRKALDAVAELYKNCPLCHTPKKRRLARGM